MMGTPQTPQGPNSLSERLRDGSLRHQAPAYLRTRVLTDLSSYTRVQHPMNRRGLITSRIHTWYFGGLMAMILTGLALSVAMFLQRPLPMNPIGNDIVSSHVRALLSQHPIDVLSSDQHTVKPWFNGKIDYALPVEDLTEQGFPLVGGRLDYVGHRAVAVLVYRFQKHPIEVYVFPAPGSDAIPAAWPSDGYAVMRWQHHGMAYWAITDASPVHLQRFGQALRTTIQRESGEAD